MKNVNKTSPLKKVSIFLLIVALGIMGYIGFNYYKTKTNDYYLTDSDISVEKVENGKVAIIKVDLPKSDGLEYSFDDGNSWQESDEYVATENGTYYVAVKKDDKESEHILVVVDNIDDTNPLSLLKFEEYVYVGDYYDLNEVINSNTKLADIKDNISVDPSVLDTSTAGNKTVVVTYISDSDEEFSMNYIITVKDKADASTSTEEENNDNTTNDSVTMLYRFRLKTNVSYECGTYDCSYNDTSKTSDEIGVVKTTGKCNDEYNIDITFNNGCIFVPTSTTDVCTQVKTTTKRYVTYDTYVVDIFALNSDGTQMIYGSKSSISTDNNDNSSKNSTEIYKYDASDTSSNSYKTSPCANNEIDFNGYCHAICSYNENSCPEGYNKVNGKCVLRVNKTCTKTCTATKWSEWSEWSTTKISPGDNIEVQTKQK